MEREDEEPTEVGTNTMASTDEEHVHGSGTSSNGRPAEKEKSDTQPKAPEDTRSKGKTVLIMLALCLAVFLAALDMTIISTAAPTIVVHFNASGTGYLWIAASYLLACAATVPSWGKFSDIFGRKPVLLAANIIFLVGSLICGISVSMTMLLVGRALQGVGGGGLLSLVNIVIGDLFSER